MLILIFAAELSSRRELVLAGALTMLVGLTGWHWPHHVPTTEAELAFEREHGIAVWPNGSPRVNRWAMGLLILLLAIALGVFLFSYFYLRLATPAWPPDNIAPPPLLLPAVSTLLVLAAAATMRWAHAAVRRGSQGGLRGALAGAFVAGALALGLLVYDYSLLPFDHTLNAYGSIFYLLGGFLMLMVGLGLAQNLFAQVWAWRGRYSAREHVAIDIGAMYWLAVAVLWLIGAGVLYLTPHLG